MFHTRVEHALACSYLLPILRFGSAEFLGIRRSESRGCSLLFFAGPIGVAPHGVGGGGSAGVSPDRIGSPSRLVTPDCVGTPHGASATQKYGAAPDRLVSPDCIASPDRAGICLQSRRVSKQVIGHRWRGSAVLRHVGAGQSPADFQVARSDRKDIVGAGVCLSGGW